MCLALSESILNFILFYCILLLFDNIILYLWLYCASRKIEDRAKLREIGLFNAQIEHILYDNMRHRSTL